MKALFKKSSISFLTILTILLTANNSFAQDPTNQIQEFTVKIDKLGDASWEVSEKMTQSQWESFKQGPLVNDPSITKRNMERSMSAYVIEDFKRDLDEMNRAVKMSFTVKAMATYKGSGHWELKLDSKNPQITKLADNGQMMISNTAINGQLIQQIFKVYFPEGASNIQQSTDSFGKALFTYSSGGGIGTYFSWNNIVGILFIVAAAVTFLKTSKQQKESINIFMNKQITNS
ncbi:MAG: hypothetical protein JO080_13110 [Mucilaginibacter sp.]|nr:hypothetical protein [Mucilaginibacter sp.]